MRFKPNKALTLISDNPSWYNALAYDALNLLTTGSGKETLVSFDAIFWFTTCSPCNAPSYLWMEALSWMFSNLKVIFGLTEYYGSVVRHPWRNMARRNRFFFLHKKRRFVLSSYGGNFLLRQLHVWRFKIQLLVRRFDNEPSFQSARLLANPLLTEYFRYFRC